MKILVISAFMPPDIMGGAEVSAFNNAHRQKENGQEVAILTAAKSRAEELHGEMIDGIRVYRYFMPRLYTGWDYKDQPAWKKALWHLQDHIDPRNRKIAARALDDFSPDMVFAHVLQGLGWNILGELGKRKIKVTCFLHDLALACYRTSMYRGDTECTGQCSGCKISSRFKTGQLRKIDDLRFISPSRANLERVAEYVPVKDYPHTSILNPNKYPAPTAPRAESDVLRLLYVGRLDALKGVDFLLSVCDALSKDYRFHLTLIGGGREEQTYREQYKGRPWCSFTGFLPQEEVSNHLNNADLLCVPSRWFEALGMVIVQARRLGVPVFGSRKGGIVEVIEDRKSGRLLTPGDAREWTDAFKEIMEQPEKLRALRDYAQKTRDAFSADELGSKILAFATS